MLEPIAHCFIFFECRKQLVKCLLVDDILLLFIVELVIERLMLKVALLVLLLFDFELHLQLHLAKLQIDYAEFIRHRLHLQVLVLFDQLTGVHAELRLPGVGLHALSVSEHHRFLLEGVEVLNRHTQRLALS
jgi:hypothetical protein